MGAGSGVGEVGAGSGGGEMGATGPRVPSGLVQSEQVLEVCF